MSQYKEKRQNLSTTRMSYEDILVNLSHNLNWRLGKLTSENLSGVAEEVVSIKSIASIEQSTVR